MGKRIKSPRYRVFSLRANDEEAAEIESAVPVGARAAFFLAAVKEKISRDRQKVMDETLRGFR